MSGRLTMTPCEVTVIADTFEVYYTALVTVVPTYAVEGADNVLLDAVVRYSNEEDLSMALQWYTIDLSNPSVQGMLVDPVGPEWLYTRVGPLGGAAGPLLRVRAIDPAPNPAYAYALAHKGLAGSGAIGDVDAYAFLFD